MATIRLDLEVNNRGDAALKSAATGLDGVGKSAGNADKQLKEFTKSQQNAALRMERMHEQALKMNTGFVSTNDKAQAFANTLNSVSSTATASAAALGLPIGQLGGLNAAADVASLGFGRLTTAAVGFNAASVGVVGAGLAIGVAIGTMLRQIGESENILGLSTKEADKQIAELAGKLGLFKGAAVDAAKGLDEFRKGMSGTADAVAVRTVDLLLSQGKTLAEIKKQYEVMPPAVDKYISSLERFNDEQERLGKIAQDDQKYLEKQAAAQKKAADEAARAAEAYARAADMAHNANLRLRNSFEDAAWDTFKLNVRLITDELEKQERAHDKLREAREKAADIAQANAEEEQKRDAAILAGKYELAAALLDLGQVATGAFGGMATLAGGLIGTLARLGDATVQGASAWQKWAGVVQGAMAAYQSGSVLGGAAQGAMAGASFGPWGAAIGAVAGGVLGFFGNKEHEKVNDMRDAFFEAAGGFEALGRELAKTGQQDLIKKIFDTKTVKDFEAAVKEAQAALDMQNLAQQRINEAMNRYGISIEDMGAKFAQQKLDEQALQLWGDWEMLNAAMGDTTAILTKMAPSMQEYIDTALAAGATIPENLRPILQQMIALGLLTDASGEAFGSLEEAGLTFGAAVEDSMKAAADAVLELVKVIRQLYGLPAVNIPVTVGGGGDDGGGGRRERGENHAAGWAAITQWGVPAMLHGTPSNPEYILRGDQLRSVVAQAIANGGSQPAGGGPIVVHAHLHLDGREIASVVTKGSEQGTVRIHPKSIGRGY